MGGSYSIPNPLDQIKQGADNLKKNVNTGLKEVQDPNYLRKVLGLNAGKDAEDKKKRQQKELAAKLANDQQEYENLRRLRLLTQRSLLQTSPQGIQSLVSAPNFWQYPGQEKLGI